MPLPRSKVTFTLRDPTEPAPKVKKRTQLLSTKPKPNHTPWRQFHPNVKTVKAFKNSFRSGPQSFPKVSAEETPTLRDDELETPQPITAEMLEANHEKEDSEKASRGTDESPPINEDIGEENKSMPTAFSCKHRELMDNRLRRMKKQSLSAKKMHYGHVMELPS